MKKRHFASGVSSSSSSSSVERIQRLFHLFANSRIRKTAFLLVKSLEEGEEEEGEEEEEEGEEEEGQNLEMKDGSITFL